MSVKRTERSKNSSALEVFSNSAEDGIAPQRSLFDRDITNADNLDRYTLVYPNDFVYNPRISKAAPFGPIRRNGLGRIGLISPLYTVFYFQDDMDAGFVEWLFKSPVWHRYIYKVGDKGARFDRVAISDRDFFNMMLNIPQVAEQKVISRLFNRLDSLIAAQECKINLLKQKKSYYLQSLFV